MKLFLLAILCTALSTNSVAASKRVKGQYLVKLKNSKKRNFLKNDLFQTRKEIKTNFGTFLLLSSSYRMDALKILNEYQEVEYAEPNFIYSISPLYSINQSLQNSGLNDKTNDPQFSSLWGLHNTGNNEPGVSTAGVVGTDISALEAWKITKGNKKIKIAVIDTGVDYKHPDLINNMWVNEAEKNGQKGVDDDGNGYVDDIYGYDFANDDGNPVDGNGHGTHCAGTIGAEHDNGEGVAGVMANVSMVAVKFLSDAGTGTSDDAIAAIDYATKMGVDIMSNSWGGGSESQALKEAIMAARDKGILFVAAAGNNATNNDLGPNYPANYNVENVISVAANNAQDELAYFSCYGEKTVHVSAPGHNILSTFKNGGYKTLSGTSMATPHMSGILGLLLSQQSGLNFSEIKDRILFTSVPSIGLRGKVMTAGRADAYNILTDFRPFRYEPADNEWSSFNLSGVIESAHPYQSSSIFEKKISVSGAKYIRLVVDKFDIENRYDNLILRDSAGRLVDKISGKGTNFKSTYVDGDEINLRFESDTSIEKWGFKIQKVEVIY